MATRHMLIVLGMVCSIMSCKKEKVEETMSFTGTPLIKKETNPGGNIFLSTYDDLGRIQKMIYQAGDRIEYVYGLGTVDMKYYDVAGVVGSETNYELDGEGKAVKAKYGTSISKSTYQYNSMGQLIKEHFVSGPLSDSADYEYYYSAQGNLDSFWMSRNNHSVSVYKAYYEYGTGAVTNSFINRGILYFGKARFTNPTVKSTIKYPNGTVEISTYSYTYDQLGRIAKVITNGSEVTSYEYQ